MENYNQFYVFIVVLSGLLTFILGFFTVKKTSKGPGGKAYFFMTLCSSIYALAYAFVLSSHEIEKITFWIKIEYIGLPFIPVFCLIMCLEYSGYKKYLENKRKYILFIIPFASVLLHYTNEYHHLFYHSISIVKDGHFSLAVLEKGSWYFIYAGYSFVCIVLGIFALLTKLKSTHNYGRLQIICMTIGLLIPVTASFIYIADLSPSRIDFAPVTLSISAIFQGVAILSFGMFNLVPIIKEKLFESMHDGVLVLNQYGNLVDYNKAATRLIPFINKDVLGKKIESILEGYPNVLKQINEGIKEEEYEFKQGNEKIYYQLRCSTLLANNGQLLGSIILITDVTEKTLMLRELKKLASIDDLTQIYNRKYFFELANQGFDNVSKNNGELAVIMLDIDHFKQINDSFGHDVGDFVIKQVAKICRGILGEDSVVGRYGGEEFVICMPFTSLEEGLTTAETLRYTIENTTFVNNLSVTASFGVSGGTLNLHNKISIKYLVKRADESLYMAKRNGRNNVQFQNISDENNCSF